MRKIKAIGNHVIVEVVALETKTEGGIFLPETVVTEPQKYGKVVSVGPDVVGIFEGNIVAFASFGGQDIILNRTVIKVLKNEEVYGVISEE